MGGPMKQWTLIGQRGVGKTWLSRQLQAHFPQYSYASLDDLIVKTSGQSIDEIFSEKGEQEFRKIENQCFKDFVSQQQDRAFIIDVGAGFSGVIPDPIQAIWLKRKSNGLNSIFVDRPALDQGFHISEERFMKRQKSYHARANLTLELREGERAFAEGELRFFRALFLGEHSDHLQNYYYTLNESTTPLEKEVLLNLGLKGFEFRDDLVDTNVARQSQDIVSLRSQSDGPLPTSALWDWPLEWGENPQAPIQSLHQRSKIYEHSFPQSSQPQKLLKVALPTETFSELKMGHQWQQQDPVHRAYLPMSKKGRWSWYRQWMSRYSPLQFIRLSDGSAADQPSVLEVLNQHKSAKTFAAVLGHPVAHSQTPSYHQNYFSQHNSDIFAIDIEPAEFNEALFFLQALGLRWAAVTAPLKTLAQELCGVDHPINTLAWTDKGWIGINTDAAGFAQATRHIGPQTRVAVWGGGGTHYAIKQTRPEAQFYSSRSGEIKSGKADSVPEILIWAVGRDNFQKQGVFPPTHWPLKQVIDLNYSQDSPGRECALMFGCQYQSGLVMFAAQAEKQQEFWNECRFK